MLRVASADGAEDHFSDQFSFRVLGLLARSPFTIVDPGGMISTQTSFYRRAFVRMTAQNDRGACGMADDRIPMTREGYDKLKAELDKLRPRA